MTSFFVWLAKKVREMTKRAWNWVRTAISWSATKARSAATWVWKWVRRVAAKDEPNVGRVGEIIAVGLLVLFGCGIIWALAKSLDPPLLADKAPPTPICVMSEPPSATPSSPRASTTTPSRSPSARPSTAANRPQGRQTRAATPSRTARPTTAATSQSPVTRVVCPGGELQYPAQARGGYDPNARIIGVVAVVGPLITTIVGFFYGARAGSSEGRALAANAKAKTDSLTAAAHARNTPEILNDARRIAPEAWDK